MATSHGEKLKEKINDFTNYQKMNPDWFKDTHTKKTRPSAGNRKKQNNSGDAPTRGSEAAAPPFLESLQADSAHPSSDQHDRKKRPSNGNRKNQRNNSGDTNNDQCDSGFSGDHDYPDENQRDRLTEQTSLFPSFGHDDDFGPFDPPSDYRGARPKTNNNIHRNNNNWQQQRRQNEMSVHNAAMLPSAQHLQQQRRQNEVPLNNAAMSTSRPHRRNDASPSVNSESPTMPLRRSAGQQHAASLPGQHAASVPSSRIPEGEASVRSYNHPSLATNATYSSSQPPSLPLSGNSSLRDSRGRNSSGGSRASSSHSNTPMLGSEAAAPPFLGSLQADSAHPSSDQGMRSVREEEFPSIPDVRVYLQVTFKSP